MSGFPPPVTFAGIAVGVILNVTRAAIAPLSRDDGDPHDPDGIRLEPDATHDRAVRAGDHGLRPEEEARVARHRHDEAAARTAPPEPGHALPDQVSLG